jgi:hypothetical protein
MLLGLVSNHKLSVWVSELDLGMHGERQAENNGKSDYSDPEVQSLKLE